MLPVGHPTRYLLASLASGSTWGVWYSSFGKYHASNWKLPKPMYSHEKNICWSTRTVKIYSKKCSKPQPNSTNIYIYIIWLEVVNLRPKNPLVFPNQKSLGVVSGVVSFPIFVCVWVVSSHVFPTNLDLLPVAILRMWPMKIDQLRPSGSVRGIHWSLPVYLFRKP